MFSTFTFIRLLVIFKFLTNNALINPMTISAIVKKNPYCFNIYFMHLLCSDLEKAYDLGMEEPLFLHKNISILKFT